MRVTRRMLPPTTTVLHIADSSTVVVDSRLTREQAALAISGLLPHAHPDLVEHWLDQEFTPRRRMFRTLAVVALIMTIGLAGPIRHTMDHTAYHHGRRRGGVVLVQTPQAARRAEYVLVA